MTPQVQTYDSWRANYHACIGSSKKKKKTIMHVIFLNGVCFAWNLDTLVT